MLDRDRVRQQRAAADDADAGLVAARLDAEHEGFGAVHVHAPASSPRRFWADALQHESRSTHRRLRIVGPPTARPGRPPIPPRPAHHDRVDVVGLVVARAPPDLDEPLRRVQRLRDRVVGPHLEEHVAHAAPRGLREQCGQQRPPATSAASSPRRSRSSGCRHPLPRAPRAARRSRSGGRPPRRRRTSRAARRALRASSRPTRRRWGTTRARAP